MFPEHVDNRKCASSLSLMIRPNRVQLGTKAMLPLKLIARFSLSSSQTESPNFIACQSRWTETSFNQQKHLEHPSQQACSRQICSTSNEQPEEGPRSVTIYEHHNQFELKISIQINGRQRAEEAALVNNRGKFWFWFVHCNVSLTTLSLSLSCHSSNQNENIDVKKNESKLCAKKSKIPKFSSPAKPANAPKSLKRETTAKAASAPAVESQVSVKSLLSEANLIKFSSFVIPDNVEDIDVNDYGNVLLAPGFSNDIYMYLYHLEEKFKVKSNFLQLQAQMNPKMRARLVDWIVAVHYKFKLLPETLYLAIAIMDRFLEKITVCKDKVQLVGVTAFFIACKYEEIYPPEITDFIKVCDAYNKNDILKMEKTILKALNFQLCYPLPLHFLRRFSKAAHADQEIHTLAKYLMELGLVEYECSSWKPSLLAAASLYLTLHILAEDSKKKTQWTETLKFYTSYTEDDLLVHVSHLSKVLLKASDSKLQVSVCLSFLLDNRSIRTNSTFFSLCHPDY